MNRRLFLLLTLALALVPSLAAAQGRNGLGSRCRPGQYGFAAYVLVCSDSGTFRYALHEDIPPPPEGGYLERPSWYPRLSDVLGATRPPPCPVSGRMTLTSPVIRPEDVSTITPQGMMVADHVTPIDHGYIGVKSLDKPFAERTENDYVPIFAPADAEVIEVSSLGSPTSTRITLAHGCETYSILMVVNRLSGALASLRDDLAARQYLAPHIHVLAGEELGEQRDNPLDFSVHDGATWLSGYVAPFSYSAGESWKPFTVDPWPYFTPELAEFYESRMQRIVSPHWGVLAQDVAGTAAGTWFLAGTLGYSGRNVEDFRNARSPIQGGPFVGKNTPAWSHLAIVPHWVDTSRWIFSIGWWRDERGDPVQRLLDVASGQPTPAELTPESGAVAYVLRNWDTTPRLINASPPIGYTVVPRDAIGVVAMQVNSDGTLTIELLMDARDASAFQGFTEAKRTYRR